MFDVDEIVECYLRRVLPGLEDAVGVVVNGICPCGVDGGEFHEAGEFVSGEEEAALEIWDVGDG